MKRTHDEDGFTLLELMVVVAIIAIIASILVPNFFHARAQAAVSACEQNIRTIATAAELYYTDNQAYPTGTTQINGAGPFYTGKYIVQVPHDPSATVATATYQFASAGPNLGYTILCPGLHQFTALAALSPAVTADSPIGYGSTTGFQTGPAPASQ